MLTTIADEIPVITEEIPRVTPDRKDDYLLAYALVGRADYLVSGDEVLRKVKDIETTKIVSPAELLLMLSGKGTA